jgi:GAF domain-containing protein
MIDLVAALAAHDQPQSYFKALERLADETIGAKLFTIMELDRPRGVARRSYSNMPDVYPVSGEKPIQRDAWTERIESDAIFVANTYEEIAAVFPDHALIASLGLESCLNVPVSIGGRVVGTLNCLSTAGHYTPDRIAAAESLRFPGAVAFLLAGRLGAVAPKEIMNG